MSSVANLHRMLGSSSQALSWSKEGEVFTSSLELERVVGSYSRRNLNRVSCSHSRQLSPGQRRVSKGVRLYVVCQAKSPVHVWPSLSLSTHSGRLSSNFRFHMHGLHFSSSGVFSDTRHVHKLRSSGSDSSNTSSVGQAAEEASAEDKDLVRSDLDDNSSLNSKFHSTEAGDGTGLSTDEEDDVPLGQNSQNSETLFNAVESSPIRRLDRAARNWVSSIVRTMSGASVSEQADIIQNEKSRGLLWNPMRILYQTNPSPAEPWRNKIADGFRRAETDFFAFSRQLGKYVIIMSGLGAIMVAGLELGGGSPHEQGVLGFSWLAGVVIGSMIGAGQVLKEHAMVGCRNVIITGSTRGLGKAMAREFLRHGDNVVITSRSADSVYNTVEELRKEIQEYSGSMRTSDAQLEFFGLPSPKRKDPRVIGIPCDVSNSHDVEALAEYAVKEFGRVDLWINNAGVNKGFRPLLEFSGEEIEQIVSTNLTGSMICTREAIKVMQTQKKGGHIFNMDGAGSGGSSTPLTAAYGATKCGLRQLSTSLLQEVKGSRVGIHTASPGMVLTDLLLSGASLQNKKMFNFICEQPETVARALVPNLRLVKGTGKAVNYLTPARIVFAIVSLWIRRGRWFDEEGRALYAAEAERLRLWAEGRERSPVTAAMELVPSGTWVSIFSSSVICAYIIFTSASNGNLPGI